MARMSDTGLESNVINEIERLVIAAQDPERIGSDKEFDYYLANGTVTQIKLSPQKRYHFAKSVDAIVHYAAEGSVIWHVDDEVVLVIDDGEESFRNDVVKLRLQTSHALEVLNRHQNTAMDQAALIRLLEVDLRDVVGDQAPAIVDSIRSVKFETTDGLSQEQKKNQSSMGRDVQSKVLGIDSLEPFNLEILRWSELPCKITLKIKIEANPAMRHFEILLCQDELRQQEIKAQEWLNNHLKEATKDKNATVLAGEP